DRRPQVRTLHGFVLPRTGGYKVYQIALGAADAHKRLLEHYACFRLKRATSRAVSRSTARFFKSARLSCASLPIPTPSSAFTFAFFQYNFRTTSVRPFTCVSP